MSAQIVQSMKRCVMKIWTWITRRRRTRQATKRSACKAFDGDARIVAMIIPKAKLSERDRNILHKIPEP